MPEVSYFPYLHDADTQHPISVASFLADIKGGQRWQKELGRVWAATGKTERAEAKKSLPCVTISGTFHRRAKDALVEHSGLVALDIDAKLNPGLEVATDRARVEADSYTYACFISASGGGLCVLVRIPPTHHEDSFRALERYYKEELGLTVDSLPDVCRLRFVSYDPALYVNEEAEVFAELLSPPVPVAPPTPRPAPVAPRPATDWQARGRGEGYGQAALHRACEKIRAAAEGEKHKVLNKMAYLCGGYVAAGFLSEAEARPALESAILSRELASEKDALKTVAVGLRDGQSKPVLPPDLQLQASTQLRKGALSYTVANELAASQGILFERVQAAVDMLVQEQGQVLLTFWHVEDPGKDKPLKLTLVVHKFRAWLGSAGGFRRYPEIGAPGGYVFVRVVDQVVRRIQIGEVISFVSSYVDELPFAFDGMLRGQLEEMIARNQRMLFDPQGLLFLPDLTGAFLRDTATAHYSFYQNCWVEVTAAGRTARPYEELPGLIWDHQRKVRPFTYLPDFETGTADVVQFIEYLTAEDAERLDQLRRALGYLIHGYKDETNARAIILMDETGEVGRSSGGTGKGLLMKCVGAMVKLSTIGSATFDFRNPFRYELMEEGTQVLFLDEWKPQRNSFDMLFADITNGFAVNRKYQAQKTIPFEEAPKFVLASNDIITGDDDSSERRKVEIALAKRYSSQHTPKDDFGRGFFSQGWDADEWVRFDNVALGWVQHFLSNGKKHLLLKNASIAARGLVQSVGIGFMEFAQDLIDNARAALAEGTGDGRIWAADAFQAYQTATGDKRTGAIKFSSKLGDLGLLRNKCRERGPRRDQWYFLVTPS
jgi:hypothetical protein